MAHLIEKSDRVYSNKGTEWHGLAKHIGTPTDSLTTEQMKDIFFPLLSLTSLTGYTADGLQVAVPDVQTVCADLRGRGEGVIPLASHTDRYSSISNLQVFEAITEGLKDFPHVITSAGTLDGCKRFFVTAQLRDGAGFSVGNETFNGFLSFITSHDGSLACQAYDSATRIVCNNTLRFSLMDAEHKIRILHKGKTDIKLENAARFIDGILNQRGDFVEAYTQAKNDKITHDRAFRFICATLWRRNKSPEAIATRTRNTIDDIMSRFLAGKGNTGETRGDLLNGFTEFYSIGGGSGAENDGAFERQINSYFGSPANHKADLARVILDATGKDYQETMEAGEKALEAYRNGAGAAPVYSSGLARNRAVSGAYGQRAATPAPVAVIEMEPETPAPTPSPVPAMVAVNPAPGAVPFDLDKLFSKPVALA